MGPAMVFRDCGPRVQKSHDQSHECGVLGASEKTW